jgi:hypothetical protein
MAPVVIFHKHVTLVTYSSRKISCTIHQLDTVFPKVHTSLFCYDRKQGTLTEGEGSVQLTSLY